MAAKTVTCRKAGNIEYTLVRGGVKNFNLRIAPDGRVRLSGPQEPLPDKAAALERFTGVSEQYFPLFEQVLNGQRPELKVRDMTTRWGVCAPGKRRITLNLRLAARPQEQVEYVVLHEYCHFVHPNHQAEFWALMTRLMPDWKQRRKALRE